MKIKKCVGAIIYNENNKIFLMKHYKWNGWVVPGGKQEKNETEIEALKREIKEEMGINITNIIKVGEKIKQPSSDYKDHNLKFYFLDYFAKAKSTNIIPNKEVIEYGWFTINEALKLNLLDTTRIFIKQFKMYIDSKSKKLQ